MNTKVDVQDNVPRHEILRNYTTSTNEILGKNMEIMAGLREFKDRWLLPLSTTFERSQPRESKGEVCFQVYLYLRRLLRTCTQCCMFYVTCLASSKQQDRKWT